MKTRILIAFVLAGGMALAQTGTNSGSTDQNQPPQGSQTQPASPDQQQPSSPSPQDQQQPASPSTQDQQQPTSPSTQPPSSNPDQSQTAAPSSANGQETVVRGCLKQSGGNWIISENGQDTTLSGDDSLFKPHDGQQVEVRGTQSSAGLQVTSVNTISDSCGGTSDTASANPSGPASDQSAAASQTPSSGSANTAQPAANPPVTNQTAPTTVGSGSQSATGTANPDQSSTTSQNPPDADTPLHPGQTPEDRRQIAHNVSRLPDGHAAALPETSSPVPLLGLLGLGSLVTGLVVRKKK
jgi:hypothetical protein